MAVSLPRLLRRVRPDLAHFQYALPVGYGGRSVATVHDLSFEEPDSAMSKLDRLVFRAVVPRAVRRADHVLAVSARTKRDIVERYGVPESKVTVTPNGVDPVFTPGSGNRGYVLFVGAIHARKPPEAALDAAEAVGLPLVVAGPEKDAALARLLRDRGADLRGYVSKDELAELYRGAAALVLPSRFEGFGLPVLEAMASGTPVVAASEPALREVADGAAVYAEDGDFGAAARRALDERDRLSAAGIERARLFTWAETARLTVEIYRRVLA
jgi:glycosyltransferase involved in cell wall biosynthesis